MKVVLPRTVIGVVRTKEQKVFIWYLSLGGLMVGLNVIPRRFGFCLYITVG